MADKGILPSAPSQADHRMIQYCLDTFFSGKGMSIPDEFDKISRAFTHAGGSWERVFTGSAKDVVLLRELVKLALKHGFITKKPQFR